MTTPPRTFRAPARVLLSGAAAGLAVALASAACGGGGSDSGGDDAAGEAAEAPDEAESDMAATPESADGGTSDADLVSRDLPSVLMRTSVGELRIELYPEDAPETVENFLRYVEDGFYDGTIFHRVVRGFVIQGGGFTAEMQEKQTRDPIRNEARNGLQNLRGTLSMARTMDPHSASSQFFVNTKDNPVLDHTSPTPRGWGYAVFGKVVSGMEAVNRVETSPVVSRAGHNDVPEVPIVIEEATVLSR